MEIKETAYYPATHDVLKTLTARQKLARWRNEQRQLPFYKIGGWIFHMGSDILAFIEKNRVEPVTA